MVEELRRSVVAAEALGAVVDNLRESRSALQQVMSKQDAQRLDVYFKRTVESAGVIPTFDMIREISP